MNTFTHQGVSPLPEARGASAAFAKRTLDGGKPPEKKKTGLRNSMHGAQKWRLKPGKVSHLGRAVQEAEVFGHQNS